MNTLKILVSGSKLCNNRICLEHIRHQTSAAVGNIQDTYYRTDEANPSKHDSSHLGRIYTVNPEVPKLFGKELNPKGENYYANNYFAPRQWIDRCSVLQETAIMVREPALQLFNYIRNSDLSKPAVRYVLYGRPGCGKSISLAHATHLGHEEGFITLTFSQIKKWLAKYYEVAPSTYSPGSIDHIMNSNIFLKNFKQANAHLLSDPKLKTHKEYTWSVREKTPAGSPLLEVINIGIDRLNFAADALNVVLKELKLNCNDDNCKLMVVCDGVNSLFSEKTLIHREKRFWEDGPYLEDGDWMKNVAKVDECSVLRNMKKLFQADYKNSVIVTSACLGATIEQKNPPGQRWWISKEQDMTPDTASHLPFALLGEEGWRLMDPFIPIEVKPYTESELDAMISYYIEKGWMSHDNDSRAARQEIHFLTGRNPADFFRFSATF